MVLDIKNNEHRRINELHYICMLPDLPGKNFTPSNVGYITFGNTMTATVFDSGDTPFMEWLSANPHGFVLNTRKILGSSYVRFHRATCRHISRKEIARADAYTTSTYIKVCSGNLSDLIEWASTNRSEPRRVLDVACAVAGCMVIWFAFWLIGCLRGRVLDVSCQVKYRLDPDIAAGRAH